MRYKPEWNGRLRVNDIGAVFWDGVSIGRVHPIKSPGARSPGGMLTDQLWIAVNNYCNKKFTSKLAALCYLIEEKDMYFKGVTT